MNEILGILDSLEATIVDSKKVPMTSKVMLDENYLLDIIDKIRLSLKSANNLAREKVDIEQTPQFSKESLGLSSSETDQKVTDKMIEAAKVQAEEIKEGANAYADDVLANLQLVISKMQKNLIHFDKNLESGRSILESKRNKGVIENEA